MFLISAVLYYTYQVSNSKLAITETKSTSLDKIYVLNLDRSVDRYKKMKEKLDALNLSTDYTRFSAVDGKKIKLVNIETKEVITGEEAFNNTKLLQGEFNIICSDEYSGDFNPVKLNLTSFHPRTIGEIGAACSHKKIWQEIVTKGYKNTLILEDDANFIAGFKKRLDNVMNNLPLDYEFVYLFAINIGDSYSIKNKDKILQTILRITDKKRENKFVKQARRNITSAVGYIVTQEGAQKLLDGFKNYYRVDKNIIELIENNKLIAYVTKPLLLDACLAQNKECETTIGTFPSHGRLSSDIVGK